MFSLFRLLFKFVQVTCTCLWFYLFLCFVLHLHFYSLIGNVWLWGINNLCVIPLLVWNLHLELLPSFPKGVKTSPLGFWLFRVVTIIYNSGYVWWAGKSIKNIYEWQLQVRGDLVPREISLIFYGNLVNWFSKSHTILHKLMWQINLSHNQRDGSKGSKMLNLKIGFSKNTNMKAHRNGSNSVTSLAKEPSFKSN